jgi:hypothetical protein
MSAYLFSTNSIPEVLFDELLITQINEIEFDGTSTMEGCEICGV